MISLYRLSHFPRFKVSHNIKRSSSLIARGNRYVISYYTAEDVSTDQSRCRESTFYLPQYYSSDSALLYTLIYSFDPRISLEDSRYVDITLSGLLDADSQTYRYPQTLSTMAAQLTSIPLQHLHLPNQQSRLYHGPNVRCRLSNGGQPSYLVYIFDSSLPPAHH